MSDHIIGILMQSKSTSHLISAVDVINGIYIYTQQGHTISHFTTDNEHSLREIEKILRIRKISLSTTPAGLHEKKAERSIQTMKKRLASTKASLSYILSTVLEADTYVTIIRPCLTLPTNVVFPP